MPMPMEDVVSAIQTSLEDKGLKYQYDESDAVFILHLLVNQEIKLITTHIFVQPDPTDGSICQSLCSYTYIGIYAHSESLAGVSEYLHRVNYDLMMGNFELDFRDGEVRYHLSQNIRGALPKSDDILGFVHIPLFMVYRYGSGLLHVIQGEQDAEDAYHEAYTQARES